MATIDSMSPITTRRKHDHGPTLIRAQRAAFFALPICILLWVAASRTYSSSSSFDGAGCLVSHGTYSGSIYAKPPETLGDKCLVESPWMRLAQHSVRLPPSGKGGEGKVVDDWLWIDYHDRINVLVEAPPRPVTADAAAAMENDASQREETSFMIISQTKYALDTLSLAVVGGIIEPREEVLTAAQREVREELKVTCRNWKVLGNKFRTDVNRGMGWVHPYLARDCSYSSDSDINDENGGENGNANRTAEVGGRDTETQQIRIMKSSEVKRAVLDGKFVEVQWSNTVALSMLHLSSLEEGD